MADATNAINSINFKPDEARADYLSDEISKALTQVEKNIEINTFLAHQTGFLDLLDQNFEAILECLHVDELPAEDHTILSKLGYCDPHSELEDMVINVKLSKDEIAKYVKDGKGSVYALVEVTKEIAKLKSGGLVRTLKKILPIIKGSTIIGGNIATVILTGGLGIPAVTSVSLGAGELIELSLEMRKQK